MTSGHAEGVPVVAGVHREHFGDGEVRIDSALLQDDAETLAHLGSAVRRIHTEDRDGTRIACAVALEDLDRRGLAGAVRAEHGDALALFDGEADTANRMHVAVRLAQVGDLDHCHLDNLDIRAEFELVEAVPCRDHQSPCCRIGERRGVVDDVTCTRLGDVDLDRVHVA